ncbi:dynein intermediate chain 4, axonemal-like [Micropterus salmoides]|uniref:dynein intermediate chain 4, axonemal-like n=1 Tax=Micropterus salmoides TaxID=27706 RepID=UPI0018EAF42C|nr:dynein intermediate chain 4, axonemal-like [Micropterus salmoides]
MKKTSVVLDSEVHKFSRAMTHSTIHQVSQRHMLSCTGSQTKISSILVGGSNIKLTDRSDKQAHRRAVRVLDNDGNNVTPLSLYHTEPGDKQPKPDTLFVDEFISSSGPDHSKSTSSFNVPFSSSFMGSSRPSSLSKASLTYKTEDSVPILGVPINSPAPYEVQRKRDNVKQHVTDEMLGEDVDIFLSETDTISLLDIPSTFVSEDADDAEAIKERNIHYAELCKNTMGNDKYVVRSMQTFSGAPKNKHVQSDTIVMVDEGTSATSWDIYDSFCNRNKTPESEKADYGERTVNTSETQEKRREMNGSSSSTGSTISSLLELEMCGSSLKAEPDPQLIMSSESFQHSLLVMERSIVAHIFQPKLAAYRLLPIEDPDSTMKTRTEGQSEESSLSPTLEHLWAFSCELTRRRNITSMAWNKENLDLLAVGYGNFDSSNQKPGLICCWSLKNPTRPERVYHCHSCVTALDFSASNPGQLAVGMYDGTIAIYNVQSQSNKACIANSSSCPKKHVHPVWQVNWISQEMRLSEDDRAEALVSVSADGRITKWLLCSNGLDCIDLMKLKNQNSKKNAARIKKKTDSVLPAMTPSVCVDFHPTDSSIYLAGTWEGPIHKCSFSNSEHFLDTYQKHFCPVNHVEWSPFCSDVFLSCSSDWTIQLWKQDRFTPVLSFTSTQRTVYTARWSPNWSTIFAAINGRQVDIWDLNSNILNPTIMHHAAPGVKVTSLLFARGTDCVLVGDSNGQVTVYQLKNLSVGEGKQVDSLEDIINSAVSR